MTSNSSSTRDPFDRVHDFLVASVSDEVTEQQFADFERLLDEDDQACQLYAKYVEASILLPSILAGVSREAADHTEQPGFPILGSDSADPLSSLLSPPSVLPVVNYPASTTLSYLFQGWSLAYLIATVIFGIGLLIGRTIPVTSPEQMARSTSPQVMPTYQPTIEFVGQITGLADCQWSDLSTAAIDGAHVPLGRKYALASGLMEITYNTGAKVVLQGPCTYQVESRSGGFLSVGKLTARVEKKAEGGGRKAEEATNLPSPFGRGAGGEGGRKNGNRIESQRALTLALRAPTAGWSGERGPDSVSALRLPPSALFSVRTPTATVTDLGTEFGVEVDKQGVTTSHVFRGSVEVKTVPFNGESETIARVLHENESVVVKKAGGSLESGSRVTVLSPSVKPVEFVRRLPKTTMKTLDLVDVVAGGDGFSGRRNRGIDPTNGQPTDAPLPAIYVSGDGLYHRVEAMPFVDGVFIPDGRAGRVQVDSAGHVFTGFPNTDNRTANYLWAGGVIPTDPPRTIPTELGGIDYASPGHGLLSLHANKGITFDLNAIRQANADYKLLRFRAVAGNTETVSSKGMSVLADIWVLIDGRVCVRRWQIDNSHGEFSMSVPIEQDDRFLTLAATDGGNGIDYDWILFGDPRLDLVPVSSSGAIHNAAEH